MRARRRVDAHRHRDRFRRGRGGAVKVLIVSASRHGSTEEIAEQLAVVLREHGISVHTQHADRVQALDDYDGVILGSAVYLGHWLPPARRFAEQHAAQLAGLPVWLFSSG